MSTPDRPADARIIPMPGVHLDTGREGVPGQGRPGDGDAPAWGTPGPAPAPTGIPDTPAAGQVEKWDPPVPAVPGPRRSPVVASVWDLSLRRTKDERRQLRQDRIGALELRIRLAAIRVMRADEYYGACVRHAPRGLWVTVVAWWRWVWDMERRYLQVNVVADPNVNAATTIDKREKEADLRRRQLMIRWGFTFGVLLVGSLLAWWSWATHPWRTGLTAAFLTLIVLPVTFGLIGGRRSQIIQPIEVPTVGGVPTAQKIVEAFHKAKITNPKEEDLRVFTDPIRDGDAWTVHAALPEGIAASEIMKRIEQLATGLGTSVDCVEVDPLGRIGRAENEFLLRVALEHPATRATPPWPLLSADRHNVFHPFPVGWDLSGRPVPMSIAWLHSLIGAAPSMGKSSLLRMVALATLADPRADLACVDFGGGVDFKAFRPYCRPDGRDVKFFIHGEGAEQVAEFRALLRWLRAEYRRRQAALAELPDDEVPNSRITEALAYRPQFRPLVVIIDEFQVATTSDDGEDIVNEWSELEKVCRKVGIWLVKATQAADDAVPPKLRATSLQRVALSVTAWQGSMALLGNTAHNLGMDASKLGGVPGYGILWGIDSPDVGLKGFKGRVSFAEVRPVDAKAMLERIAQYRPARDDLAAAAEDGAGDVPEVLVRALEAWPRPGPYCHAAVLAERMGVPRADLTAELAAHGVMITTVRAPRGGDPSKPDKGWRLVDVEAAVRAAKGAR